MTAGADTDFVTGHPSEEIGGGGGGGSLIVKATLQNATCMYMFVPMFFMPLYAEC
jgi:hypothetical protein